MAYINRGLKGLPGLNSISEEERQQFMLANEEKLRKYRSPGQKRKAAEILYNNQMFKQTFGEDSLQQAKAAGYDYNARNTLLRDKIVNDAFESAYMPVDEEGNRDDSKGLGNQWEKYNKMSTDAKYELLNSGWRTPEEMKEYNEEDETWYDKTIGRISDFISKKTGASKEELDSAIGLVPSSVNEFYKEARNQHRTEANQKILDRIYNDDVEKTASKFGAEVSQAYYDPEVTGRTDDETKQLLIKEATPGSYDGNYGISELASHFGTGSKKDLEKGDLEDLSIDEMRQILAKKYVYDRTMSPEMSSTVLNNEIKRYIKDHQSSAERFGLFATDVGIAAMSYTADKINGLYNIVLAAEDKLGDKPTVYVDDRGEVLDPTKYKITQDLNGELGYQDEDGQRHSVHKQEVARTALHNMGKEFDGRDSDEGVFSLNPNYWTKAEQFGTLNPEEQKQYEKLGSSPYKVMYDPNEDSDLWYESFKMMSFAIADAASILIPFGVGMAGRAMSAASKAGSAVSKLGNALDFVGTYLGAQSKVGQVMQGVAGATGIAYAYNRGAFQETLAKNLSEAEETLAKASKEEVYNNYNSDENYKNYVDSLIASRAEQMKMEYLAQLQSENRGAMLDEEALDKTVIENARNQVLQELVQDKINTGKSSQKYADLQNQAIREAGDAAVNTFLPEAIKYGIVNTMGFRKWLYTNPASLAKKASPVFEGMKEVVTSEGKRRLTTDPSKFVTIGQKAKQLGKVAASQVWGGAWTNGTDDMMVDAAERISDDAFQRYLDAYQSGESDAGLYGFTDGLYSYWKGLQNSLGQETTWNAAAVGGLGSLVSFSPNMANIAHLMSKEGRDAYKQNFKERVARNDDGSIKKDENGNIIYDKADILEQANYFIQNGILNTYYANRQNERDLRQHADYVNTILSKEKDFEVLSKLLASNNNGDNLNDETGRFIGAINTIGALGMLANNSSDPLSLSSVVEENKALAAKIARGEFSEAEAKGLLSQYYKENKVEQNDANNQTGIQVIMKNAQELQEAMKAYDAAERKVQAVEKNLGTPLPFLVREDLKMKHALHGHWEDILAKLKDSIGDSSGTERQLSDDEILASYGQKNIAQGLVEVYDKQVKEGEEQLAVAGENIKEFKKKYEEAQKAVNNARTSNERYEAQNKLSEARAQYENARQEAAFVEDNLELTKRKRQRIVDALENNKDKEDIRVLTADEIFALDAATRARIMNPKMRAMYSKEQQAEIEKLENKLLLKDDEALDKIQRIASISSRLSANENAYGRMIKNPEAAAVQLEKMKKQAADNAYDLINKMNAETLANFTSQMDEALKVKPDVTKEEREQIAFDILKRHNSRLLDIIDRENLVPEYGKALEDAKKWVETVTDIEAVISSSEHDEAWKKNIRNILDTSIKKNAENTNNRNIIAELEKFVDDTDGTPEAAAVEEILKDLQVLGYQRDTTVVEDRQQRREREAAAKKKLEEDEKKAREKAEEAARKAVEEAKKAAEEKAKAEAETKPEAKPSPSTSTVNPIIEIDVPTMSGGTRTEKVQRVSASDLKEGDVVWYSGVETETPVGQETVISVTDEGVWTKGGLLKNRKALYKVAPISDTNQALQPIGGNPKDATMTASEDSSLEEETPKAAEAPLPKYLTSYQMASMLMEDDAESSSVTTGAMWGNDGKAFSQGEFKVSLDKEAKNPTIKFTRDSKAETLNLAPEEWQFSKDNPNTPSEGQVDSDKITKETPFVATALEKINGNWYFKGTFDGSKKESYVAVSDKFDLGAAIERQVAVREAQVAAKGINPGNKHLIKDADNTYAESPTLAEEAAMLNVSDEIVETPDIDETDAKNDSGEQTIDAQANTVSANAMIPWEPEILHKKGILKRKVGAEKNDPRNQYNEWMATFTDALGTTGVKLQDIIDTELHQILAANPHLKIKFMATRATENATHDDHVNTRLFLVVDYDNSVNPDITSIHDKENGGVIESEGKRYLIVGVAGYGDIDSKDSSRRAINEVRRKHYDVIFGNVESKKLGIERGLLQKGRAKYFEDHPSERFRILENVATEVIPGSLIPGYFVKQLETDTFIDHRPISEILPEGMALRDIKWGIQQLTDFLPINARRENLMLPKNSTDNSGSTFAFIPAANGKYAPVHIDPLFYQKMRPGVLLNRVTSSVERLASPQYAIREQALNELFKIFHLTKGGNNILIGKEGVNVVSFVKEGIYKPVFTIRLDNNPNALQEIKAAFTAINPRVNITPRVLTDNVLLEQFNEAGALNTDVALFRTAGASYAIYPVTRNGDMVVGQPLDNRTSVGSDNTFRGVSQVAYEGEWYNYDASTNSYTLRDTTITDKDAAFEALELNRKIAQGQLEAVKIDKKWKYYIIDRGEHPEVARVEENSKVVEKLSEEDAKKLIDEVDKQQDAKEREDNAKAKIDSLKQDTPDGELDIQDADFSITVPSTTVSPDSAEKKEVVEEKKREEKPEENVKTKRDRDSYNDKSLENIDSAEKRAGTQTFKELLKNKQYKMEVLKTISDKWEDSPLKFENGKLVKNATTEQVEKFLREKLGDKKDRLDNIGTDDTGIQAFIRTIKEC